MTPRQQQIIGAMQGRMAATVNDTALRDAVRSKLVDLATKEGRPLNVSNVGLYVTKVLESCARSLIFEAEVPIALEMGAAGELETTTNITQTNCGRWVTLYAACGDRRAAQQQISLQSARDRARTDAVASDSLREDFQKNGLRRAWDAFLREGWTAGPFLGSALYDQVGVVNIREMLKAEEIAQAKADARAELRHDDPRRYRTMPDAEVEVSPRFQRYWKARLVRAYFEALKAQDLDINYRLSAS